MPMDSNTHSAFISGKIKGVRFSAFVDGIPDKCKHKWNGDTVMFTESGKEIHWYTYRQWASYTDQMRRPLVYKYQEEILDPIRGETTSCSKCKKVFHPSMHGE